MIMHPKDAYALRLRDPRWQRKRIEILERDGWKCSVCACDTRELQVHHLAYAASGAPWDTANDKLETLCDQCHLWRTQFDRVVGRVRDTTGRVVLALREHWIGGSPIAQRKARAAIHALAGLPADVDRWDDGDRERWWSLFDLIMASPVLGDPQYAQRRERTLHETIAEHVADELLGISDQESLEGQWYAGGSRLLAAMSNPAVFEILISEFSDVVVLPFVLDWLDHALRVLIDAPDRCYLLECPIPAVAVFRDAS